MACRCRTSAARRFFRAAASALEHDFFETVASAGWKEGCSRERRDICNLISQCSTANKGDTLQTRFDDKAPPYSHRKPPFISCTVFHNGLGRPSPDLHPCKTSSCRTQPGFLHVAPDTTPQVSAYIRSLHLYSHLVFSRLHCIFSPTIAALHNLTHNPFPRHVSRPN